jgi:hypothetical protein
LLIETGKIGAKFNPDTLVHDIKRKYQFQGWSNETRVSLIGKNISLLRNCPTPVMPAQQSNAGFRKIGFAMSEAVAGGGVGKRRRELDPAGDGSGQATATQVVE